MGDGSAFGEIYSEKQTLGTSDGTQDLNLDLYFDKVKAVCDLTGSNHSPFRSNLAKKPRFLRACAYASASAAFRVASSSS